MTRTVIATLSLATLFALPSAHAAKGRYQRAKAEQARATVERRIEHLNDGGGAGLTYRSREVTRLGNTVIRLSSAQLTRPLETKVRKDGTVVKTYSVRTRANTKLGFEPVDLTVTLTEKPLANGDTAVSAVGFLETHTPAHTRHTRTEVASWIKKPDGTIRKATFISKGTLRTERDLPNLVARSATERTDLTPLPLSQSIQRVRLVKTRTGRVDNVDTTSNYWGNGASLTVSTQPEIVLELDNAKYPTARTTVPLRKEQTETVPIKPLIEDSNR